MLIWLLCSVWEADGTNKVGFDPFASFPKCHFLILRKVENLLFFSACFPSPSPLVLFFYLTRVGGSSSVLKGLGLFLRARAQAAAPPRHTRVSQDVPTPGFQTKVGSWRSPSGWESQSPGVPDSPRLRGRGNMDTGIFLVSRADFNTFSMLANRNARLPKNSLVET